MMTTNEIRQKFLDFFKSKNHSIIASDSLVPKDDPTVLFTTAGMQQFKRQFLGYIDGFTRAATSQKCLRTDDLDRVGKTPCHHTFFEMLGNFSFGDYFKKDAIAWAWEFLTKELKLNGEKLWVSVYEEDEEAYNEWVKIGFPKEKIVRLGDKDNFWPAEAKKNGPNGPCGPCSEIFFDYGVNPECKSKKCDPSCSCGRFTEVWNLVFTQFNRKDGGVLEPLPGKNIDTGMGLERLAAVVQGKKNNYETDLFEPILKAIDENIKGISGSDRLIIADHIRAITFGIADGVIPSNEGRGYIMKKLIIDITDIVLRSGKSVANIRSLVAVVCNIMSQPYPELTKKQKDICEIIDQVEKAYIRTRNEKMPELNEILLKQQSAQDLGKTYFLFRDTHGLSLASIVTVAKEAGVPDGKHQEALKYFDQLMEQQKERSRAGSKMTGDRFADIQLELAGTPKTKFIGYEYLEGQAKILKLFVDDKETNKVVNGDHVKVILDQTPFYAEAGGQIGDTGYLVGKNGKIRIIDTKKQDDIYLHFGEVEDGEFKVSDEVEAKINSNRRKSIMSNHTATHLLQAALRKVLGAHVGQQGSLVDENRLRFDFTQPKSISPEEILAIENQVNDVVAKKIKVDVEKLALEEAKKKGALAFFAEKYGAEVRVVTIGDYSKEFCGGTHVANTSDIEFFKIVSQGSVAQGIRRIEAKTAEGAKLYIKEKELEKLQQENSNKQKALQEEENKKRLSELTNVILEEVKSSPVISGSVIFTKLIEQTDVNYLKRMTDLIKQAAPSSAIILGTQNNGSATIVVGVTDDLILKGLKANELINEIGPLMDATGGGRPQLAQAGSKSVEKLQGALTQASEIIKKKLKI